MQNFVEKGFQVIIVFYWGGDRVQIQLGPLNQQIANLPTYSQRLNQVMFFFRLDGFIFNLFLYC